MPAQTTSDFGTEGRLSRELTEAIILKTSANFAPIYAALTGLGSIVDVGAELAEWWEQDLPALTTAVNNAGAAYDATTTAIVVDSVAHLTTNMFTQADATGEVMLITAINTGSNTITVVRGVGKTMGVTTGVAAAAGSVANDAVLRVIGYAAGEGATTPGQQYNAPSKLRSWMQTFRRSVELTGRAAHVTMVTGNERARLRQVQFNLLLRDIEQAFIFGAGDDDTIGVDSRRVTSMTGLYKFLSSPDAVGGSLNLTRWHQFCERAFQFGSPEKVLFAGPTLMSALGALYAGKLQVANLSDAVGLRMTEIVTPFGLLRAVLHRNLTAPFAGDGIVVDPAFVQIQAMQPADGMDRGRPHLRTDVQAKGADAITDEWFAELLLQPTSVAAHDRITGVTGAA